MKTLRDVGSDLEHFRTRIVTLGAAVVFAFFLLLLRLVQLQIFEHESFFNQAENNRLASIPSPPSRGLIYDRNGIALTANTPSFSLDITAAKNKNFAATVEQLAQIVPISAKDIKRYKRLRADAKSFEPVPIRTQLTEEEMAKFAANSYRFPGVEIRARLLRRYPFGETASHVVGYIGRINKKEKERIEVGAQPENYSGTEYIGKVGVERHYENLLHGTTGLEKVETTAAGRAVRQLRSDPAVPGSSIYLSIDIKLQKMVEDLFGPRRGALVAIDPNNGEVLALVSKPTYDPNIFLDGIDTETWKSLNESINKPLLNRALRGTYPPGSTYKPFMALAALELGIRNPQTYINDPGYYQFGSHRFRGHAVGSVNMHSSIVQSSNVYYYSLANEMGVEAIYNFMHPFGFGQVTGIDLYGETKGVLPNQEWKRNTFKRPDQKEWMAGETISLGIGQGYNSFTPLQLASATATLANGGRKFVPQMVIARQDGATQIQKAEEKAAPTDLKFRSDHVSLVHKAMGGVARVGTSHEAFANTEYVSAGKTGTAQAVSIGQKEKYNAAKLEEHQRDHSLYIAFAPLEAPKIALAVIVENAGFGATSAAPIARRVFDYWLLGRYPSEIDIAAVRKGKAVGAPLGKPRAVADITLTPVKEVGTEEDLLAKDQAQ